MSPAQAPILEAIEISKILLRRDEGHIHRPALGSLTKLRQPYPAAGSFEFLKIADNLGVIRQLEVVAGPKAKRLFGCRNRGARGTKRAKQNDRKSPAHVEQSYYAVVDPFEIPGGSGADVLRTGSESKPGKSRMEDS